jgi:diaminopimelate decarboxylase
VDTDHYYSLWNAAREQVAKHLGHPVKLEIEPGRFLVAESGVLVAQVRSVKEMGSRHFVLIDAGFNDLMRPSMYGSYHHITALAADGRDLTTVPRIDTVVAGPLCESGDVFTQQEGGKVETRALPAVTPGITLCCMIPGLMVRPCRRTTTVVRCCRKCCLITALRG